MINQQLLERHPQLLIHHCHIRILSSPKKIPSQFASHFIKSHLSLSQKDSLIWNISIRRAQNFREGLHCRTSGKALAWIPSSANTNTDMCTAATTCMLPLISKTSSSTCPQNVSTRTVWTHWGQSNNLGTNKKLMLWNRHSRVRQRECRCTWVHFHPPFLVLGPKINLSAQNLLFWPHSMALHPFLRPWYYSRLRSYVLLDPSHHAFPPLRTSQNLHVSLIVRMAQNSLRRHTHLASVHSMIAHACMLCITRTLALALRLLSPGVLQKGWLHLKYKTQPCLLFQETLLSFKVHKFLFSRLLWWFQVALSAAFPLQSATRAQNLLLHECLIRFKRNLQAQSLQILRSVSYIPTCAALSTLRSPRWVAQTLDISHTSAP